MSKNKFALLQIELPALEQSKEGKLRGGFTVFNGSDAGDVANVCNNFKCYDNTTSCENNSTCYNNSTCKNNITCYGNPTCQKNGECNRTSCQVTANSSADTCGQS